MLSCLSLTSEKGGCTRWTRTLKGIETSIAQTRLEEIHSQWRTRVPADPGALGDWLLDQEQAVVLELLAFCAGQTVHAVRLNHDSRTARLALFVAADRLGKSRQP